VLDRSPWQLQRAPLGLHRQGAGVDEPHHERRGGQALVEPAQRHRLLAHHQRRLLAEAAHDRRAQHLEDDVDLAAGGPARGKERDEQPAVVQRTFELEAHLVADIASDFGRNLGADQRLQEIVGEAQHDHGNPGSCVAQTAGRPT